MLKHLLIWLYNAPSGSRFSRTNYSPFPNILLFTSYAAFKRQGFFTALNPTLEYIMSAYQEANTMTRVGGDTSPKCRVWCGENPNRDRELGECSAPPHPPEIKPACYLQWHTGATGDQAITADKPQLSGVL